MLQCEMDRLVPRKLKEIEEARHITILWAAEAGSRAWGFASPDSDFDIRFIYKRNPEEYLKLNHDRDVIDLPIDDTWDVNGWDLDKTLKLLYQSNPTLFEWLDSPIIYRKTAFAERIQPLLKECFSQERMLHHYLGIAQSSIKRHLQGDTVKPKKYFYALRPILACIWIRQYHTAPPVLFSELSKKALPEQYRESIDSLLYLKVNSPEKQTIEPIPDINKFLAESVRDTEQFLHFLPKDISRSWDALNRFFLSELYREDES